MFNQLLYTSELTNVELSRLRFIMRCECTLQRVYDDYKSVPRRLERLSHLNITSLTTTLMDKSFRTSPGEIEENKII